MTKKYHYNKWWLLHFFSHWQTALSQFHIFFFSQFYDKVFHLLKKINLSNGIKTFILKIPDLKQIFLKTFSLQLYRIILFKQNNSNFKNLTKFLCKFSASIVMIALIYKSSQIKYLKLILKKLITSFTFSYK